MALTVFVLIHGNPLWVFVLTCY